MGYEKVRYLDIDVVTAAKARIRYLYESYDHVLIGFSGGKDSLTVITLARAVLDEMGRTGDNVQCVFYDEEIIPDNVIEFVQSYRDRPGFALHYFAVPMASHIGLLGKPRPYVQWGPDREWVRQPPDYAIRSVRDDGAPTDQHDLAPFVVRHLGLKGKVAMLTGIRAQESVHRFSGCVARKNELNYIAPGNGGARNIDTAKPIYDWSEGDVFKYFKDTGTRYAPIYDMQMYAQMVYRVATPLIGTAYKLLSRLRETYPTMYAQILSIWPEVETQERYWGSVDKYGVIAQYPKSFAGIHQYVMDTVPEESRGQALKVLGDIMRHRARNKAAGKHPGVVGHGFPLLYVFRAYVAGTWRKDKHINQMWYPSAVHIAYEQAAEEEERARATSFNEKSNENDPA